MNNILISRYKNSYSRKEDNILRIILKINKLILILLYFFLHSESALSNDKLIKELQYGGKIIFIRHALAPGNSDPDNINLNDCQTQRNLDARGIEQSKKIGYFFKKSNL
mgnify:CR=1 FL=1